MRFASEQHAFAAALADPASPVPAGVVTARGDADALRFAVYRNNVFVGLTKALAQRFPVTERLVGVDFFAGMARAYAQVRKPASPLMFRYGGDFPDFIATFPPAASLPYLPDVARLEAAWTDAYHAADAARLDASVLAGVAPARLPAIRLSRHPAARLIRSAHPVGSIWAAHQGSEVAPVAIWQAETVLVVRPGMDVGIHILPASDADFAEALFRGATLEEAAAAGSHAGFDFGAALVGLLSLGAFGVIDHGDDE